MNSRGEVKEDQKPESVQNPASGRAAAPVPEPPELETVGQRVAWLREFLGLSLQDFGQRIGYDGSQISRIERNRCTAVNRFVRVVCSQYRVKEAWLRHGMGLAFDKAAAAKPAPEPATPKTADAPEDGSAPPKNQETAPPPLPGQTETLIISAQDWEESWKDLKSYVDLLAQLSPVGRAELGDHLHALVDRVCSADGLEDKITITTRVREGEEDEELDEDAGPAEQDEEEN